MATATLSPKVDTASQSASMLLSAKQVAVMLSISVRTLYRLKDLGVLPSSKKLGTTLARWNRAEVEQWVRDGMPSCRTASKGGAR